MIPYALWETFSIPPNGELSFENGFIVIINPETYFCTDDTGKQLELQGLFGRASVKSGIGREVMP